MKELMEMREKRLQSWNAAKAFLDSHRGADGTLSAEDDAIFNKMMDDVDKLGKEVVRLERMEAMDWLAIWSSPVGMFAPKTTRHRTG